MIHRADTGGALGAGLWQRHVGMTLSRQAAAPSRSALGHAVHARHSAFVGKLAYRASDGGTSQAIAMGFVMPDAYGTDAGPAGPSVRSGPGPTESLRGPLPRAADPQAMVRAPGTLDRAPDRAAALSTVSGRAPDIPLMTAQRDAPSSMVALQAGSLAGAAEPHPDYAMASPSTGTSAPPIAMAMRTESHASAVDASAGTDIGSRVAPQPESPPLVARTIANAQVRYLARGPGTGQATPPGEAHVEGPSTGGLHASLSGEPAANVVGGPQALQPALQRTFDRIDGRHMAAVTVPHAAHERVAGTSGLPHVDAARVGTAGVPAGHGTAAPVASYVVPPATAATGPAVASLARSAIAGVKGTRGQGRAVPTMELSARPQASAAREANAAGVSAVDVVSSNVQAALASVSASNTQSLAMGAQAGSSVISRAMTVRWPTADVRPSAISRAAPAPDRPATMAVQATGRALPSMPLATPNADTIAAHAGREQTTDGAADGLVNRLADEYGVVPVTAPVLTAVAAAAAPIASTAPPVPDATSTIPPVRTGTPLHGEGGGQGGGKQAGAVLAADLAEQVWSIMMDRLLIERERRGYMP